MSVTDVAKDTINAAIKRADSPVIGTFVLTWSLANWPVLINLFFSNGSKERISYIEWYLQGAGLLRLLGIPLFFMILYIFIYPLIRFVCEMYLNYQEKQRAYNRLKNERDAEFYKKYLSDNNEILEVIKYKNSIAHSSANVSNELLKGLIAMNRHVELVEIQERIEDVIGQVSEVNDVLKNFKSLSATDSDEIVKRLRVMNGSKVWKSDKRWWQKVFKLD